MVVKGTPQPVRMLRCAALTLHVRLLERDSCCGGWCRLGMMQGSMRGDMVQVAAEAG